MWRVVGHLSLRRTESPAFLQQQKSKNNIASCGLFITLHIQAVHNHVNPHTGTEYQSDVALFILRKNKKRFEKMTERFSMAFRRGDQASTWAPPMARHEHEPAPPLSRLDRGAVAGGLDDGSAKRELYRTQARMRPAATKEEL